MMWYIINDDPEIEGERLGRLCQENIVRWISSIFNLLFVFFAKQDKVRTESYRDFMYRNPDLFQDKVGGRTNLIHNQLRWILMIIKAYAVT